MKYNKMDQVMIEQLFETNPVSELSGISGDSLIWEDIWIAITGFENVVKAIYPPAVEYPEFEVYYKWDGKKFIEQSRGLYEPTGGDLVPIAIGR